jgi:hypothetical protein
VNKLIAMMVFFVSAAGCKQALDQRCQVTDDCEEPLICNQAKMVCALNGSSSADIDADVPILIDAAVDAP